MWSSKRQFSGVVAKSAAASLALSLLGAAPLALANEPNNGPSHCGVRYECWNGHSLNSDDWRWRDHDRDHDNFRSSQPYYYMHGPSQNYNYPDYDYPNYNYRSY